MKSRHSDSRRVRSIGRLDSLREFMWETVARRASRRLKAKHYPAIAAVPTDAIGRELFYNGLYEEDLLTALFDEVLQERRVDFAHSVVIDAGANVGNHTLYFASRFRQVVAFEPNPPIAKILEANVELNSVANVVVRPVGLSDTEGELEFTPGVAANFGAGSFASGTVGDGGPARSLPVRVGDRELQRLGIEGPIALLKIDVEGHELAVLRGLRETLERESPLVLFESNSTDGECGGAEIIDWLATLDYRHVYSVGTRWALSSYTRQRWASMAGLIHLGVGFWRGASYWLQRVERLDDRVYPLLLASRSPL